MNEEDTAPFEPEEGPDWSLVMPFVVCASQGGPYDDDAFVAGYHLGQLDVQMANGTVDSVVTLRASSMPQFDLIAMRHGYELRSMQGSDGWVTVAVHRTNWTDT